MWLYTLEVEMKKLFISFDYEGMGGVCNWKQVSGNSRYNELITTQVNAFLEGVYDAIPDAEIVFCDSHSDGNNVIYEKLYGNTRLISGYPREYYMMEGIDASFDGLIFLGYHAPIGRKGNMDHTYSSGCFHKVLINGKEVSEAHINAMLAAHYKVPLLFMLTDDSSAGWMKENLSSKIAYLVSKRVISRYAAEFKPWGQLLHELKIAGRSIERFSPWMIEIPDEIELEIELNDTNIGYAVQIIPGVRKLDERRVSVVCKNPLEMYKYLMTCVMTASSVRGYYLK